MSAITEKAQTIRLLILDVDGVLTSGHIYYANNFEMRGFHIQDGLGIKLLQQTGISVAVISGKNSPSVQQRLQDLQIKHFYLGQNDKLPAFIKLKAKLNIEDQEIAYMGDDLPDLPILRRVHLPITVPNAPEVIKSFCSYVTQLAGGQGAVREVCELILKAQNKYDELLKSYFD